MLQLAQTDSLTRIVDAMFPIMQIMLMIAGVGCAVVAATALFRGRGSVAVPLFGSLMCLSGVYFLPQLLGVSSGEASEGPSPEATPPTPSAAAPIASPTMTPSSRPQPSESADLTVMFITLGVLAGLILLVILIWLIAAVIRRSGRALAESKAATTERERARNRLQSAWDAYRTRHDELLREYLHAETDWDSLFFLPALTDPTEHATSDMLQAMRTANTMRDVAGELPSIADAETDLTQLPYPRAVDEYAKAWEIAKRNAKRIGQSRIPKEQRRTIAQIRTLLDFAQDGAASEVERELSYRRAQNLIDTLTSITIPERTLLALSQSQNPALSAANDEDTLATAAK